MDPFICPECALDIPHDHGTVTSSIGTSADAIIYRSDRDPNAELRDPESGEVIFRAKKAPFRLIEGGLPPPPKTGEGT